MLVFARRALILQPGNEMRETEGEGEGEEEEMEGRKNRLQPIIWVQLGRGKKKNPHTHPKHVAPYPR